MLPVAGLKTRTDALAPGASLYAARTLAANTQVVFGPAYSPDPQARPPANAGAGLGDEAAGVAAPLLRDLLPRADRHSLVATALLLAVALALTATPAQAAGSRNGATRAAKRHTIAYVKRYGITLRVSDLDLQCSVTGRSRWKCFVYANDGQRTGTLTEVYSTRAHAYRARNIDIGCAE